VKRTSLYTACRKNLKYSRAYRLQNRQGRGPL